MEQALGRLESDPEVRVDVVVITGADERAFVAGGDIKDLNSRRGLAHYNEFGAVVERVFRRFGALRQADHRCGQWVGARRWHGAAAVHRPALIAEGVRIGLPEIKLGLFPGWRGGSQRLMRQLPLCQAKMLTFIGDAIDAGQRWGSASSTRSCRAISLWRNR